MPADERLSIRQHKARPAADLLLAWLAADQQKVPDVTVTVKAIEYSLRRWVALTRFVDYGAVSLDNNRVENLIRPIALGRKN